MAIQTSTSGYFNKLVSSISGDEYPLMLLTFNHADLGAAPFRWVNDNQDIVSNSRTFTAASFSLSIPSQPQEGLTGTSITIPNTGDKIIPDFIESVKGQGVTAMIEIVLRSAPNIIEYQISLEAGQFVIGKEIISARLQSPNYYTTGWASILFGAKYSPSLL